MLHVVFFLASLEQARAAITRGDFGAARQAAREVLERDPKSAEAEVILGLSDTAENRIADAEKHFLQAVRLQPANYRAYGYLGSTYLRQKRLGEAEQTFARVLELNPGNAAAQYNLGLIATLGRKPKVASSYFAAVLRTNPSDAAALLGLLECQLDLRQMEAARRSAARLETLLPASSPVVSQVAAALASSGEYEAALPFFRRAAATNRGSPEAAHNLGLALLRANKLEEARQAMEDLERRFPTADGYDLLGSIREKQGDLSGAAGAFAEAARLAPSDEDIRVNYAAALANGGALSQSAEEFAAAVKALPESLRLRLGSGSVLYLLGRYDEAATAMLEATHRSPTFAPAYDLLGKIYESAPAQQEAIANAFQIYLQSSPPDAAAYTHYGNMLFLQAQNETGAQRFDQARQSIQRASTLDPKLASAHLQLGIILQTEGKWPAAVSEYQRAAALSPKDANVRYRLGSAYQKLGDSARAQAELAIFRKLKQDEKEQERKALLGNLSAEK